MIYFKLIIIIGFLTISIVKLFCRLADIVNGEEKYQHHGNFSCWNGFVNKQNACFLFGWIFTIVFISFSLAFEYLVIPLIAYFGIMSVIRFTHRIFDFSERASSPNRISLTVMGNGRSPECNAWAIIGWTFCMVACGLYFILATI